MKLFLITAFTAIFGLPALAQKLPEEFVSGISNAIHPKFASHNDSLDMYTVALILSNQGIVLRTVFSEGIPSKIKEVVRDKVGSARIGLIPLHDYWKKYCQDNNIRKFTCLVMTFMTRFEGSSIQPLSIEQSIEKSRKALTFRDPGFYFQDVNVIWLPPKISSIKHEEIMD